MARGARTFQLTQELLAQHAAGQVLCLAHQAEGRSFQLHRERPGPELNETVAGGVIVDPAQHMEPKGPVLVRVDIRGVIEQRAGYHDYCGGWSDGHDAIADRLIEAFEFGDVVLVIDSPGGAANGMAEAFKRVQAAKAEMERRVYVFAEEMALSAGYWWATIGDEIYLPASGTLGSIGARASHVSIAGALAKDGVEVTHFSWPGDGKVAFAGDRPLSEVGRARGERDIAICGEAFAAAVESARGLSRDAIVTLNADCLIGEAAVSAGLADDVASLEDVIEHALAVASGEESTMKRTEDKKPAEANEDPMPTDAEGDEPAPEEEGDDPEPSAEDEPEPDMEGEPDPEEEDEDPDEELEDEEEPKAKRTKAKARAARSNASLAELVGARAGSSSLAIKTAALRQRQALDAVMRELGADDLDELVGNAKAVAQDATRLADLEAKHKKLLRQRNAEKRMSLARKLADRGLPGLTRGDLFVDEVNDRTGKRSMKLAREYREMRLETFEAFVNRKLKGAGPSVRRVKTPFDPDAKAAKEAQNAPRVEEAKRHPAVLSGAQRSYADADKLAAAFAAQFPNEAMGGDPGI